MNNPVIQVGDRVTIRVRSDATEQHTLIVKDFEYPEGVGDNVKTGIEYGFHVNQVCHHEPVPISVHERVQLTSRDAFSTYFKVKCDRCRCDQIGLLSLTVPVESQLPTNTPHYQEKYRFARWQIVDKAIELGFVQVEEDGQHKLICPDCNISTNPFLGLSEREINRRLFIFGNVLSGCGYFNLQDDRELADRMSDALFFLRSSKDFSQEIEFRVKAPNLPQIADTLADRAVKQLAQDQGLLPRRGTKFYKTHYPDCLEAVRPGAIREARRIVQKSIAELHRMQDHADQVISRAMQLAQEIEWLIEAGESMQAAQVTTGRVRLEDLRQRINRHRNDADRIIAPVLKEFETLLEALEIRTCKPKSDSIDELPE